MAKFYGIKDEREYPDYVKRDFPKHLGFDEIGAGIIVADEDEESARLGEVVYPKLLGKDRAGRDVIAMGPTEEGWKSKQIVTPAEPKAEEAKRGPGRPRTSEAA